MSTETTIDNSDLFYQYLDSFKGEVKSKSTDGYYHVDVVAEAYNKGFLDGEKSGKKEFLELFISNEIEKFTHKANQIYILSKNIISLLNENEYSVSGLYINLSPSRPSVIISASNDLLNNDDFVKLAYTQVFENKGIFSKLFNETLDIGLISSDNLDENLLEEDGFGYVEKY